MLTGKDDYSYIAVFIDYLRQIIDIIIKLFNGLGDTATDDSSEDAQ